MERNIGYLPFSFIVLTVFVYPMSAREPVIVLYGGKHPTVGYLLSGVHQMRRNAARDRTIEAFLCTNRKK